MSLAAEVKRAMDRRDVHSISGLARVSGIGLQTANRLLKGEGVPSEQTLQRVADALHVDITTLRRAAGRPAGERTPFTLPERANQLSDRQRTVVLSVIDALLEAGAEHGADAEGASPDGGALRLVGRLRDPDGPATPGGDDHQP